ncbi:MAG: SIMPL domain-containing protein [Chloroflexi bacterium]|nr:SIMPL domain-containing protein [Chloroflexota bacterium]
MPPAPAARPARSPPRREGWGRTAPSVHAQDVRPPETAAVTVVGDGLAKAKLDTTTIRLGVEVTARTPGEAFTQTWERSERVITRLRALGVPEADVQTAGLNVFPIHEPPKGGPSETAPVSGYRGSATIVAQEADPGRVTSLIAAGLEAGANMVQGLSFGIRSDDALRKEALAAAVADAYPRAEAAATAAGLALAAAPPPRCRSRGSRRARRRPFSFTPARPNSRARASAGWVNWWPTLRGRRNSPRLPRASRPRARRSTFRRST